jgi:D-glycero-D-manno-heptose 1,7-bisphosphate phosphatase
VPGAVELIRAARSVGMPVVEITNQAGIGRGEFGWPEFADAETRLAEFLGNGGLGWMLCSRVNFIPAGSPVISTTTTRGRSRMRGYCWRRSGCLNLDLSRSLLVGDETEDVEATRNAGLSTAIQVLTVHGPEHATESTALATVSFRVLVVRNAALAIPFLG